MRPGNWFLMPSQLLRSEEEEKDILELIMLSSQWWPQSETKFTVHTFIQDWVVQVVCMCASVCVCVHALELWLGKKLTWVNQLGAVWQSQNNRNLFHNFWILWRIQEGTLISAFHHWMVMTAKHAYLKVLVAFPPSGPPSTMMTIMRMMMMMVAVQGGPGRNSNS